MRIQPGIHLAADWSLVVALFASRHVQCVSDPSGFCHYLLASSWICTFRRRPLPRTHVEISRVAICADAPADAAFFDGCASKVAREATLGGEVRYVDGALAYYPGGAKR